MGRLQSDPSPSYCQDQDITTDTVTTITLVIKTRNSQSSPKASSIDCIDIVFRGGAASIVSRHLRKGDKILVECRLRSRTRNGKRTLQVLGKKVIFIHLVQRNETE